jgi:hypothetical protein
MKESHLGVHIPPKIETVIHQFFLKSGGYPSSAIANLIKRFLVVDRREIEKLIINHFDIKINQLGLDHDALIKQAQDLEIANEKETNPQIKEKNEDEDKRLIRRIGVQIQEIEDLKTQKRANLDYLTHLVETYS